MELFINDIGIISPAGSSSDNSFLRNLPDYDVSRLLCMEPLYTDIIPAAQLRRMSKVVRMGVAAAKMCTEQTGTAQPDALSVGTAYGCLQDTELFLDKMVTQNEQMLSPTAFIQSTHNTVAGQIALLSQCHGHNLTFSHKGHSFEHAAINAQLYLHTNPGAHVLLGGIDELTDTGCALMQMAGIMRTAATTPQGLIYKSKPGTIPGEGAAFFLCSNTPVHSNSVCIRAIDTFITPDKKEALQRVNHFLYREGINAGDIDMVVFGANGDDRVRPFYNQLKSTIFHDTSQAVFKHLSGEYPTASSFAAGMIAHFVKNNYVPDFILLNAAPEKLKKIVLINNYIHYYSYWYMEVI